MASSSFPEQLLQRLHTTGVIAVLTLENVDDAVPTAQALLAGGVDCIELTLRTPTALDALKRIRAEVPDMMIGAGTVLSPAQAQAVKEAGADFGVAPGTNPRVIAEAARIGLPFGPGVCTPTDIELSVEQGCRLLKFFPSEPSGGLAYLKTIAAPFEHLGVEYIPLGGVSAENADTYLRQSFVRALGGSWLAPKALIQEGQWQAITRNAAHAQTIVKNVRGGTSA